MKKLYVNSVSLLFAVLCLVFTACNQGMTAVGGEKTGTVRITIGGESARAVDSASGLPVFHKDNTKITVTKADGTKVVDGEQKTEVTLQLPAGTEITVKVEVTTAAGEWSGLARHTVTEGANTVSVKLSKAAKTMRNILINSSGRAASLKLESGEELLENIPIEHSMHHDVHPVIARDSIGRIYVLYRNSHSATPATHLRRIDVEGNGGTDTGFHDKIIDALPPSTINAITNMAIDVKHNYIFLFNGSTVYCLKEKEDHSFEYIVQGSFPIPPATPLNVTVAAAYNDVLFVVNGTTLYACKFEIEDLPAHPGLKQLQFKPVGGPDAASLNLPKLRSNSGFSSNSTKCTGLFADKDGVYCLLSENSVTGNKWYMVGAVVQCAYKDNGTLEQKGEPKGLNPDAPTAESIKFKPAYFSNPVCFIGSDEDNLYIADDGVDFEDINENWHITANKNRIAALNRKTHDLTFKDAGATWYGEGQPYSSPNTPVLLWKNDGGHITYWTSADGTESFNATNKLFEYSSSPTIQKPTDAFCYDQDGNLYILWTDGSGYAVRRFELKDGTSYVTPGEYSPRLDSSLLAPSYIAVDISGGQNYLYCGYKDIANNWKVGQMEWVGNFSTLTVPIRTITVGSSSAGEELTALAANKDGVFVAVKETYQGGPISKYRLKVKKYKKSDGTPNGGLTLVDGAAVYTDMSDAPIELGSLSPGVDYKEPSEVIDDLQVVDNVLYGISSKLYCVSKKGAGLETFKNSGILYKIGNTDEALSASSLITKEKPADDTNKIGYGFYRFIAVKPKKLVIASDGGWGKDGLTTPPSVLNNKDTVFECDLSSMMLGEGKQSGGSFSHTLVVGGSGFEWANP